MISKGMKIAPSSATKFSHLTEYYGRAEFYKRFLKRLNKSLVKYYGERETKTIFKLLNKKIIKILNPEMFLTDGSVSYDPSVKALNDADSLNDFFTQATIECLKFSYEGCSTVPLTWFLYYVATILDTAKIGRSNITREKGSYLQPLMNMFVSSLCTYQKKNPFVIRILDRASLHKVLEINKDMKTHITTYTQVLTSFFQAYDNIKSSKLRCKKPKVEMIVAIFDDYRNNQEKYLGSVFSIHECTIHKYLKEIPSLDEPTATLRAKLEYIRSLSNYPYVNIDDVLRELQRIKKECRFRTYPTSHNDYHSIEIQLSVISSRKMVYRYITLEHLKDLLNPSIGEIEVDCSKLSLDDIRIATSAAVELSLVRYRLIKERMEANKQAIKGDIKIFLKNVSPLSSETIKEINTIKENLESLHNKRLSIIPDFKEKDCSTKLGSPITTHIRVISDIHADINEGRYEFDFGNDFVINCGDTSGDCLYTTNWVRSNMRKGLFTSGNHLGYNQPFPELNGPQNLEKHHSLIHEKNTVNGQAKYLGGEFANYDVKYLNDSYQEYEGIIFIGCPLYTNFLLFDRNDKVTYMNYAKYRMNDYKYPKAYVEWEWREDPETGKRTKFESKRIVTPDPQFHKNYHLTSMRYLTEKVREFKGKPIVIFTHHAPLPYSLAPQYRNDPLSAAFASDLRYFLNKFPYIRAWFHGHVHNCNDYIYGNTRVVSCPFGYYNENNVDPKEYGKRIAIKDIKSLRTWEDLLAKEIHAGKVKVYKPEELG